MQRRSLSNAPGTVTVTQVAERAGVSTATVSRVLSGSHAVRQELRKLVLGAARELGYRPNRAARNLRKRVSRTVGVLVPDIENPFFTSVICGIEEVLQEKDYSLLLANYDERPERETNQINALLAEGVGGLIFAVSRDPSDEYETMAAMKIPMVAVSRRPGKLRVDQVMVANAEGARAAVAHLISLGHKRIGLVSGPASLNTARERNLGYELALADAGLKVIPELVVREEFRQAGGYAGTLKLLALRNRPTAIFTASNLITLGALQAIHARQMSIPDDIAIVGFDDMPWAVSLQPPLTAVAQPARDVGRTAAQLLLERLGKPDLPKRVVTLDTTLIVRASCGAAAAGAAP